MSFLKAKKLSDYNKKQTGRALIQSLFYVCVFFLFTWTFNGIKQYYIKDASITHGPIDSRVSDCKFFDGTYVYDAKHSGYNKLGYFKSFLPLDLAFPILYTIMFLTILAIFKKSNFYKPVRYIVFAGMILDYLENITFSLYLKSSLEISSLVAFFTTIKTFVFLFNLVVFAVAFSCALFIFFRSRKDPQKSIHTK